MATITTHKSNWVVETLTSSIGRKLIMALSGLFLILFLAVHLVGNLQLLKSDAGESFNKYAQFMGHNPVIQTVSIGNFAFILLHIVTSILLAFKNKKARPVEYAYTNMGKSSSAASRNMMLLGSIVLIFILVHLSHFWFRMKFGEVALIQYDGSKEQYKNLYDLSVFAFKQWWIVAFYVIAMIGLGFHLSHGFQSAFQTLGLNHSKYTPAIKMVGLLFSIAVPAGFAAIPVIMFLK